jgi:hypothetical protein
LSVKARNVLFELGKNFVADFQTVESLSGHGKRITRGFGELFAAEGWGPSGTMCGQGGARWRS